jgi:hypothetical protein
MATRQMGPNAKLCFASTRGAILTGARIRQHLSDCARFQIQCFANDFERKDRARLAPIDPACCLVPYAKIEGRVAMDAFLENR